jgi:hypothetical protein
MFRVRNLLHFFKVKLGDSFRAKPKSTSLPICFGIGLLSLSFFPSLAMEQTLTRSKRKSIPDEQPLKQIHIDILNILKTQLSPIALQDLFEYDLTENIPSFPNFRISKSDLSRHVNLLIIKGFVVKSVHGFTIVSDSSLPLDQLLSVGTVPITDSIISPVAEHLVPSIPDVTVVPVPVPVTVPVTVPVPICQISVVPSTVPLSLVPVVTTPDNGPVELVPVVPVTIVVQTDIVPVVPAMVNFPAGLVPVVPVPITVPADFVPVVPAPITLPVNLVPFVPDTAPVLVDLVTVIPVPISIPAPAKLHSFFSSKIRTNKQLPVPKKPSNLPTSIGGIAVSDLSELTIAAKE